MPEVLQHVRYLERRLPREQKQRAMTAYGVLDPCSSSSTSSASKLMIGMCKKIPLVSLALVFLHPPHPADFHHTVLYMRFMMFLAFMVVEGRGIPNGCGGCIE